LSWIETIADADAQGPLRREYDAAVRRAGKVFQILKIQSLNPEALRASIGLYVALMHGPSPLPRATREMLAVVVSRANDCHY
jgi:alkylhydroperoxidase family enzyme